MKVVIDTNLMLVMLPEKSADHDLFLALLNGEYEFCVTPDILLEYEEIIARKNGAAIASAAIELLVSLPNVHFVNRYSTGISSQLTLTTINLWTVPLLPMPNFWSVTTGIFKSSRQLNFQKLK